jgi:hypothetical protein
MSKIGIFLAILLYLFIAIGNLKDKDYPHAMMWLCYCLANVALLWYEYTKGVYEL